MNQRPAVLQMDLLKKIIKHTLDDPSLAVLKHFTTKV